MTTLATLDEFKLYAGIKNPENDDRLESVLTSVSALIKTYCNRTFNDYVDDDYEEYFDGGCDYLYPKEFPILDVSDVSTSIDYGVTFTSSEYIVDKRNDRIYIASNASRMGPNAVKITYTGGFMQIPSELKLAVFDMMNMYLKNEAAAPKKTQGFTSVEYITSSDFPSHIKRVLDLYRVL